MSLQECITKLASQKGNTAFHTLQVGLRRVDVIFPFEYPVTRGVWTRRCPSCFVGRLPVLIQYLSLVNQIFLFPLVSVPSVVFFFWKFTYSSQLTFQFSACVAHDVSLVSFKCRQDLHRGPFLLLVFTNRAFSLLFFLFRSHEMFHRSFLRAKTRYR